MKMNPYNMPQIIKELATAISISLYWTTFSLKGKSTASEK